MIMSVNLPESKYLVMLPISLMWGRIPYRSEDLHHGLRETPGICVPVVRGEQQSHAPANR